MNAMQSTDALLGGRPFTVRYLAKQGEQPLSETVFVRALAPRHFQAYLAGIDDEPATAELLCSKPKGWADALHPDSLGELVTLGEEVNAPFFQPWLARRLARKQRLLSGVAGLTADDSGASLSSSPVSKFEPAEAAAS